MLIKLLNLAILCNLSSNDPNKVPQWLATPFFTKVHSHGEKDSHLWSSGILVGGTLWVERTKLREWTLGHRDPQMQDKGPSEAQATWKGSDKSRRRWILYWPVRSRGTHVLSPSAWVSRYSQTMCGPLSHPRTYRQYAPINKYTDAPLLSAPETR